MILKSIRKIYENNKTSIIVIGIVLAALLYKWLLFILAIVVAGLLLYIIINYLSKPDSP